MAALSGLNGEDLRFCVVTPNYNMAEYLEETICSVLANIGPGDEYFIIDGGSTDGSVDIIRRYEDRLGGWLSEPDRGYADAIAKGFAMSSAPLMSWINCGDILLDGSLNLRRAALSADGCDLIFGDDYYIDEQGYVLQHSNGRVEDLFRMMLYGEWTPLQDACSWHRSLYEASGGIDPDIRYAADYDMFLRMSAVGRACYLPAVLSAFRRHDSQKSVCGADHYAAERYQLRMRSLSKQRNIFLLKAWRRFFYAFAVKCRARVSLCNRRGSEYIGCHISDIKAQGIVCRR